MHEMSIAQSILDIALEEIAKQGCDRLDLIRVECGALAGVVPDSLQGGPHAAARLELVTIPLLLCCSTCGQTFGGEGQEALWQPCPACGALAGHTVVQGKELQISHLEASVSGGQDS